MELTQVIKAPVVTEKSTTGQAGRKYTFMVHPQANKIEVQQAVERAYGVKVEKVNIAPVLKKVRQIGRSRQMTKRHAGKKAVVTVAPKQTIDFNKVKTS